MWYNGRTGKFNSSLNFDGGDDYVNVGDIGTTVNSISFWIKPSSLTQSILDLNGGTSTIEISSGTITLLGFDNPTVYVDGNRSTSVTDTNWHMITVTTQTPITASNISIGKVGTSFYQGQIDGVRLYSYALTPTQIGLLLTDGGAVRFAPEEGTP